MNDNQLHAFILEVERRDGSVHYDTLNAHSSGEALHLWAEAESRRQGRPEDQVISIQIEEFTGVLAS